MNWINFLRKYGPIPRNDNMYDETIQRIARRYKISPIEFEHPFQADVLSCFDRPRSDFSSVILTGTAGDGKTHLCRKVWEFLEGDNESWASNNPYLKLSINNQATIHFIRDLSAWVPQQGHEWESDKETLLHIFCQSLFVSNENDIFLIAANDGQLIETFGRLKDTEYVIKVRNVFEDLLVEDRQTQEGVRLRFYNLSRGSSSDLFQRAIESFISDPGWDECLGQASGENEAFGPKCPIRQNYELLKKSLVQSRLKALFELCDYNDIHVPLRQILLLLTNAVLGHPDVKDCLMVPNDIPKIIESGTVSKASLYNNIFGGNLSETRRQSITIFDYFERFQLGYETTNRIDNLLIFGDKDENLNIYFNQLVASDKFYGADERFYKAQRDYIEGIDEGENASKEFLEQLISQRRGLFFKIPKEQEEELKLWELTVFNYAGEYLESVSGVLKSDGIVERPILSRIIKGLNRIFTGMLINNDREIILATSGNYSQAKICRILVDRISVDPSKGEKALLRYDKQSRKILLSVYLSPDIVENFNLNLVRYEFLSRVAQDGALPASFSKECYEDILAFKSQLIAAHTRRQEGEGKLMTNNLDLKLIELSDRGMAEDYFVEVRP